MRTTKHYVRLLYPGIFFPEERVLEVVAPRPEFVPAEQLPKCYAFEFFTRDSDGDLLGPEKNKTGVYYRQGAIYNEARLAMEYGKESIIYKNVIGNGYKRAVRTHFGNYCILRDADIVLREIL